MNTITLPTSTETRERLVEAGWSLTTPPDLQGEEWMRYYGEQIVVMRVFLDGAVWVKYRDTDVAPVIEFASLIGLGVFVPAGHVVVPEDALRTYVTEKDDIHAWCKARDVMHAMFPPAK